MVIMSPLHYPSQAASRGEEIDESRIGAGAHPDYGCLALLAQDDKGGLQGPQHGGSLDRRQADPRDVRGSGSARPCPTSTRS